MYKNGNYNSTCRECNNAKRREYLARPEVKQAKLAKDAIYRNKPENREHMKQYHVQWYADNREEKLRKNYENEKARLARDPQARIRKALRVRIKDAMKGLVKADKTLELLGCDREWFRKWLEYQFENDITWDNYGSYWHMDHVRPCASFDLTDPEQQRKCFNWQNIRPVEKTENMLKSDQIDNMLIQWQDDMVENFIIENGKNF